MNVRCCDGPLWFIRRNAALTGSLEAVSKKLLFLLLDGDIFSTNSFDPGAVGRHRSCFRISFIKEEFTPLFMEAISTLEGNDKHFFLFLILEKTGLLRGKLSYSVN